MKTRRNMIAILTLCAALSLTACGGNNAGKKTADADTKTETNASSSSSDDEINKLYEQENQFFADHKEVWDKAFLMMQKSSADPSGNYADYLAEVIEANKDSFTEDELKTLHEDIEAIRKIEEKIAKLEKETNASSSKSDSKSDDASPFHDFAGKDLDGNEVDETLFSKNAVTVLNFWFTGCKPCVAELSKLNDLNEEIKSMGGEVVGINTETFDDNEAAITEAKKILKKQGAAYRNISIASDSDAGKYASTIMAFPTTILVDRNGNIVGEPMLGGIDNKENYDSLMKQIQSVIDADNASK